MAYLNDRVYDEGLLVIENEANAIYICNAEPATYAEATTVGGGADDHAVGNASGADYNGAVVGARGAGGREAVVAPITDGSVTVHGGGSDTATHWALVDTVNFRLLATNDLAAPQVVTDGNDFTLSQFTIGIPAPA